MTLLLGSAQRSFWGVGVKPKLSSRCWTLWVLVSKTVL